MPLALSTAPLQIRSAAPSGRQRPKWSQWARSSRLSPVAPAAAQPADHVAGVVARDRGGRPRSTRAAASATARKEEPGWSLSSRARSPPAAATSALRGRQRHRARRASARRAGSAGSMPARRCRRAPSPRGCRRRRCAITAAAPASVTACIRSANEGKPGDVGPVEQDQHHRAADVGAGQLVDAAVGQAGAMAGEDHRRVGDRLTRASRPVSDDARRRERDRAAGRRSSAPWRCRACARRGWTVWNQLPFSPAGSRPRARNCAAI